MKKNRVGLVEQLVGKGVPAVVWFRQSAGIDNRRGTQLLLGKLLHHLLIVSTIGNSNVFVLMISN